MSNPIRLPPGVRLNFDAPAALVSRDITTGEEGTTITVTYVDGTVFIAVLCSDGSVNATCNRLVAVDVKDAVATMRVLRN